MANIKSFITIFFSMRNLPILRTVSLLTRLDCILKNPSSLHRRLSSWLRGGRDGGGQTRKPPPLAQRPVSLSGNPLFEATALVQRSALLPTRDLLGGSPRCSDVEEKLSRAGDILVPEVSADTCRAGARNTLPVNAMCSSSTWNSPPIGN